MLCTIRWLWDPTVVDPASLSPLFLRCASENFPHPQLISTLGRGWYGLCPDPHGPADRGAVRWGVILIEWASRGDVFHLESSKIFSKCTTIGDVIFVSPRASWAHIIEYHLRSQISSHLGYKTVGKSYSFLLFITLQLGWVVSAICFATCRSL